MTSCAGHVDVEEIMATKLTLKESYFDKYEEMEMVSDESSSEED